MSQTGSLTANFHEGARSEYLAQFALSALGMAAAIPRQEDVGVDLQCALGERIGRRLVIDQYFLVQVKSSSEFGAHDGKEAVRWLCSHRHPIFYLRVNKRGNRIDLFQTTQLVSLFWCAQVSRVVLAPDGLNPTFEFIEDAEEIRLSLGPPILSFTIAETESDEWRERSRAVLRSWIELDQANIDQKWSGLPFFSFPSTYKTNVAVRADKIVGNFKGPVQLDRTPSALSMGLMKHLSVFICRAAAERNIVEFRALITFVRDYVLPRFAPEGYSQPIVSLAFFINAGAEHLGLSERLHISSPDGTPLVPSVSIRG